mmetsp:Transcript_7655/g.13187  ORF Transcript_7655/g.13187 Transcript_7655/m.13187 type:complete len:206 (+) Transcript_7655:577-1194(+)
MNMNGYNGSLKRPQIQRPPLSSGSVPSSSANFHRWTPSFLTNPRSSSRMVIVPCGGSYPASSEKTHLRTTSTLGASAGMSSALSVVDGGLTVITIRHSVSGVSVAGPLNSSSLPSAEARVRIALPTFEPLLDPELGTTRSDRFVSRTYEVARQLSNNECTLSGPARPLHARSLPRAEVAQARVKKEPAIQGIARGRAESLTFQDA